MTPNILISACLLGLNCRYDGTAKETPELNVLLQDYRVVPFCPELFGGLIAPRLPAEIRTGDGAGVLYGMARVQNQNGQDLTPEFIRGAQATLALVKLNQPCLIVAKANSPSCGAGKIYDGSFTGGLKNGDGVTTALLRQAGFAVYTETDLLSNPAQILGKNKY